MVKNGLLHAARRGGMFALSRRASRKSLRILAYHGLWTTPGYQYGNYLFMTPEQFERRMIWLRNSCYPVLRLGAALQRLDQGDLPDHAVVITIDDGWSSTYTHMLPVLERLGLPATVYATTWYSENQLPVINVAVDYILRRTGQPRGQLPELVGEIEQSPSIEERERVLRQCAARFGVPTAPWWEGRQFHVMSKAEIGDADRRGLDIQLHTHRHRSGMANCDNLAREIGDNRAALAAACGRPGQSFRHFCYPSGDAPLSAAGILKSLGIGSATLVEPGLNPPGANPYRLYRYLDGRAVSDVEFEAYLSGAHAAYRAVRTASRLLTRPRRAS
ncbi:MAG: polysaccharide deacetylase family protein [Stellaceae bacterium]